MCEAALAYRNFTHFLSASLQKRVLLIFINSKVFRAKVVKCWLKAWFDGEAAADTFAIVRLILRSAPVPLRMGAADVKKEANR